MQLDQVLESAQDLVGLGEDRRVGATDVAARREGREGVEIVSAAALGPASTATTLRTRGGALAVTEGPYAEAIEGLGGFYLIEAPDLDTVLDLLQVLPAYDMQVQPVINPYE